MLNRVPHSCVCRSHWQLPAIANTGVTVRVSSNLREASVHLILVGPATNLMGGVTSMDGFLDKFFPSIKKREAETPTVHNLYCQYNSQTLQLMTSSLFIAGAICELSGTTGIYCLLTRIRKVLRGASPGLSQNS